MPNSDKRPMWEHSQLQDVQQWCDTECNAHPVEAVNFLDCHILPTPGKVGLINLQKGCHSHNGRCMPGAALQLG